MQTEDASKTTKFRTLRLDCGAHAQLGPGSAFVLQVDGIEINEQQAWRRSYEDVGARVGGISMFLCISTRDSCCHFPLPGTREKLCDLSSVQLPRIVVHLCDTQRCSVDVLSHSEIAHEKKLIKVSTPAYADETGTG